MAGAKPYVSTVDGRMTAPIPDGDVIDAMHIPVDDILSEGNQRLLDHVSANTPNTSEFLGSLMEAIITPGAVYDVNGKLVPGTGEGGEPPELTALTSRVTQAESDIDTLEGKVTALESAGGGSDVTGFDYDASTRELSIVREGGAALVAELPLAGGSTAGLLSGGDQTVAGVKSFTSSPQVPAPASSDDATNRGYVDGVAAAVQTAVSSETAARLAADDDLSSSVTALSGRLDALTAGAPTPVAWLVEPEVFEYDANAADPRSFTLAHAVKFALDVLVLKSDSFLYLQASDYSLSGNKLTINSPTLVSGDRVKISYAV